MATSSIAPPIAMSASGGSIQIYEHGAHLTSWIPADSAPVIWMSSMARFEPGIAIRGGVPIIFPWFGAGRSGDLMPAHGFARTQSWTLHEQSTTGQDAVVSFTLHGSASDDANFPYAFAARYEVRLGSALHLTLTVENTGSLPFTFEEALHTYFSIGDVRQIHIEGLHDCRYLDQADPHGLIVKEQQGAVRFTGETDRIYRSSGQVRIVDPILKRTLTIDKEHSASTVVWNPWIDKAKTMSDFGDDEWPSMVCIEGGNLRESAVFLEAGQRHDMRYSVHVEPIG